MSTPVVYRCPNTGQNVHGWVCVDPTQSYESVKADPSWTVIEITTSGHVIMLEESEWLADVLMKAA